MLMPNKLRPQQDEDEDISMKKNSLLIALILFVILFGTAFLSRLNLKIKTKQDLADYYSITRKTLTKWVDHFTNIDIEIFNKKRKIEFMEVRSLLNQLGHVNQDSKVLTKKEIKQLCDTSDRVLRDQISIDHCGLSLETYKKMNIFPPKISKKILEHVGVS